MIEIISADRCTNCNVCVRVCPTDVFDRREAGPPIIARQDDCQTCFLCEANCPADAMYVAPLRRAQPDGSPHREETSLAQAGTLGSYRRRLGWGRRRRPPRTSAQLYELAAER